MILHAIMFSSAENILRQIAQGQHNFQSYTPL